MEGTQGYETKTTQTQMEPETPLALERKRNLTKIMEFRNKIFVNVHEKTSQRNQFQPISEITENYVDVEKYHSDGESEETASVTSDKETDFQYDHAYVLIFLRCLLLVSILDMWLNMCQMLLLRSVIF